MYPKSIHGLVKWFTQDLHDLNSDIRYMNHHARNFTPYVLLPPPLPFQKNPKNLSLLYWTNLYMHDEWFKFYGIIMDPLFDIISNECK